MESKMLARMIALLWIAPLPVWIVLMQQKYAITSRWYTRSGDETVSVDNNNNGN